MRGYVRDAPPRGSRERRWSGTRESTLVRSLAAAIASDNVAVELFAEEDILTSAEFASVMREFRTRPRVELLTLLDASRDYLRECERRAKDVYILDALFPYWLSLTAWGYDDEQVPEFLATLAQLSSAVRMVEVYLDGDLDPGLLRASQREGPGWIESQIAKISTFPSVEAAPISRRDVAAYYRYSADRREPLRRALPWPTEVIDADQGPEAVLAGALATPALRSWLSEAGRESCHQRATS